MRQALRRTEHSSAGQRARVATVAHRGACAEVAENTLAAIRRAVARGADVIEVDVQRTRDGVPVLLHDTTLVRTTNVRRVFPDRAPWLLADFTYAELMRLDAGSWKSPGSAGATIPTLTEAVEVLREAPAGLLLELKHPELYPGLVRDVVAALRGAPGYVESAVERRRLVVQSFSFTAVKEHKTLLPSVPVGLLGTPSKANLPALATWADQVNPSHFTVDGSYVDRVHALGMGCMVWTVNRGPAMRRAIRMGVDGVITNRPDLFRRVLSGSRR